MSDVTDSPADEPDSEEAIAAAKSHRRRARIEWAVILVVALIASLALRSFAFQTFYIPSGSMEPTLMVGDRIVVDKLAVDWGTVNRGDIVVFHAPPAENCGAAVSDLVKRVVGLPGDTVSSINNTILINGQPLVERWPHTEPLGTPIRTFKVPANSYFMIGDNHNNSCDSRMWGSVPRSDIIGKAFLRIWPFSRAGLL